MKTMNILITNKVSKALIRVNIGDLSAKKTKNVFIQTFFCKKPLGINVL